MIESSLHRGSEAPSAGGPRPACCYLPREVFFGRLGFAGVFFTAWAGDFGRFLPATSDSFPVDMLVGAPYRGGAACAAVLEPLEESQPGPCRPRTASSER
jgi:hypothetical protein